MFFKTVYMISQDLINESTWNLVHLFEGLVSFGLRTILSILYFVQ